MSFPDDLQVSRNWRPKPEDYDYDLDAALDAVVGLTAIVPGDAFTAETLGTERAGNGVLINDGLVLTMGYLVTEADTIWLSLADGRTAPGHLLGYDQPTGFGLVQPLARLDAAGLPIGDSVTSKVGDRIVIAGAGGRRHALAARIVGRQEFAGYWEYVLDDAIFTAPSHPHWGGTAAIGAKGELIGVGSLQVQAASAAKSDDDDLNMVVPIDVLKPILDDLVKYGRRSGPARPWLGMFATQVEDKVVVVGLTGRGPAQSAGLRTGDIVLAAAGTEVSDLATLYRRVWSLGEAGVEVPLTLYRDGRTFDTRIASGDRAKFLKSPMLH